MAINDPRDTIIAHLCRPAGTTKTVGDGPPQAVHVTGGPTSPAIESSIIFRKKRVGRRRRLYAVTYADEAHNRHLDVIGVDEQVDGTWIISGSSGGSGTAPSPDHPWLNIGGWWNADSFCGGGEIVGSNRDRAARVQLVFADGSIVEDRVEHHLALFLIEHAVELPARVNIFDDNQDVIAQHVAWGFPAPGS